MFLGQNNILNLTKVFPICTWKKVENKHSEDLLLFQKQQQNKEKPITTNKKPPPKNNNTTNNTEAHFDNLQVHIWSEYIVEWLSIYLANVQVSLLQGEDVCPKCEGDSLYESKSLTGYF